MRYTLIGRATCLLHKTQQPHDESCTPHVLYDEFDLEQKRGTKVFTHALLMTTGLEFRIKFFNLRLRWFSRVLLANSKSSEMEKAGRYTT